MFSENTVKLLIESMSITLSPHMPRTSYWSDQHSASCLHREHEWWAGVERRAAGRAAGSDEPFSRTLCFRQTIRRSQRLWRYTEREQMLYMTAQWCFPRCGRRTKWTLALWIKRSREETMTKKTLRSEPLKKNCRDVITLGKADNWH